MVGPLSPDELSSLRRNAERIEEDMTRGPASEEDDGWGREALRDIRYSQFLMVRGILEMNRALTLMSTENFQEACPTRRLHEKFVKWTLPILFGLVVLGVVWAVVSAVEGGFTIPFM